MSLWAAFTLHARSVTAHAGDEANAMGGNEGHRPRIRLIARRHSRRARRRLDGPSSPARDATAITGGHLRRRRPYQTLATGAGTFALEDRAAEVLAASRGAFRSQAYAGVRPAPSPVLEMWKTSAGGWTCLGGGHRGSGSIRHFPDDAVRVATA
jgi:hypothetical protein